MGRNSNGNPIVELRNLARQGWGVGMYVIEGRLNDMPQPVQIPEVTLDSLPRC